MSFLVVGVSHRSAPLELLEKLTINKEHLPASLEQLSRRVSQGVVLSTCNRLEVYTPNEDDQSSSELKDFLASSSNSPVAQLEPHIYQHRGGDCVNHLFRVVSGLDSMVVGDRQILGQIQTAYCSASDLGLVRGSLSKLFHQALQIGCRVHRESIIGNQLRSVSEAGVQLVDRLLDNLPQRKVLVIGAGDAGHLAAKSFADLKVSNLVIMNRTYSRAEYLAQKLGGVAAPFQELPEQLVDADVVVSSTGSPGYVLDGETVREAMRRRNGRPLLLVDIAMPRDIDPSSGEVPGVQLFDIESLQFGTEFPDSTLEQQVSRVEEMAKEETTNFLDWCKSLDTVPLIAAIRDQAEKFRRDEVSRTLKKLEGQWPPSGAQCGFDDLSSQLELMTSAIVKKLLHHPTVYLKEGRDPVRQQLARELFNITDEVPSRSSQA